MGSTVAGAASAAGQSAKNVHELYNKLHVGLHAGVVFIL